MRLIASAGIKGYHFEIRFSAVASNGEAQKIQDQKNSAAERLFDAANCELHW
jgi:hypothetical protein